jgi:multicomponent Na+:H+ antiporter subunit F
VSATLGAEIALAVLAAAALVTGARLLRGPSLPDRVVALDLLSTIGIGAAAAGAVLAGDAVLLDAALIVALVTFLGTVAFARYLEGTEK